MTLQVLFGAVCLIAVISGLTDAQGLSVTAGITQPFAHVGDNVTFTCRVMGLSEVAYPMVLIEKRITLPNGNTIPSPISKNDYMYPLYRNTGRYLLRENNEHDIILISLSINNVQYSDTARIGCRVDATQAVDDVSFEVYKPPKKISFNNLENNTVLVVDENESVNLMCHVHDVVPLPEMHITAEDGHSYTTNFKENETLVESCLKSEICLPHYSYNYSIYHEHFKPKFVHNGKQLFCRAGIPETEFPPAVAALTLNITYSPKFECAPKHTAKLHTKKYELSCKVNGNPEVHDLTWNFRWGGKEVELTDGGSVDDGEITASTKKNTDGSVDAVLTFNEVAQRHFWTYKLRATNTKDTNMLEIALDAETHDSSDNGASCSAIYRSSMILMLSLLLFVLRSQY